MNQQEFVLSNRVRSQCDAILDVLIARRGEWVSMPELSHASGAFAVHSRISDLRQRGYTIDQKSVRTPDRVVYSYYRLRETSVIGQPDLFKCQGIST